MEYHSQREHANDGMPGGIHTHAYATTANLFASALSLSMCVCRSIPSEPSAVFHRHDVISKRRVLSGSTVIILVYPLHITIIYIYRL